MTVTDIAQEIYLELGSPTDNSIPFTASWLRWNIGELNILIDECFVVDSVTLEIFPELSEMQKSIFKKMYFVDYYKGKIQSSLSTAGYLGKGWISLKEGDSEITRANPNEIAKTFRGLMNDVSSELNDLVKTYKMNGATPTQVAGDDTISDCYYTPRTYRNREQF